jgi:hypothetical protein
LKPERVTFAPEMKLHRDRRRWLRAALIAALCAAPLAYLMVVGGSTPQRPPAQLVSAATMPVAPPTPLPASPPVLARDDAIEPTAAGDARSSAGKRPAAKLPERKTVAMVTPGDRVIAPPAPKPVPQAPDPEMIALLVQLGEQLVEAGDFATARTLFQRAAEADDAAAATALGATYDPAVLASVRAIGIAPDVVKARFWYEKAAQLGSSDARRRLELMANR